MAGGIENGRRVARRAARGCESSAHQPGWHAPSPTFGSPLIHGKLNSMRDVTRRARSLTSGCDPGFASRRDVLRA